MPRQVLSYMCTKKKAPGRERRKRRGRGKARGFGWGKQANVHAWRCLQDLRASLASLAPLCVHLGTTSNTTTIPPHQSFPQNDVLLTCCAHHGSASVIPLSTLACCTLAQSAGRAPPLCFQRASGSRPRRTGRRSSIGGGHWKTCHFQQEIDYVHSSHFSHSFIVLKFTGSLKASPCFNSARPALVAPLLAGLQV